ncbi:MAG TPA: NAD(P)/FAD-dependent oxidoreductase [Acidimicrobiales bacterium]|nr:NAD(P)/FAD-dependent oxidoreductase [Acidimicrobiales bacterium]
MSNTPGGQKDYDVVVVGARVAGSVLSALLGAEGRRVALVDKATAGTPTVSTHFFRGGGLVSVLDSLGLIDAVLAEGTPRLTRQWVHSGSEPDPVEGPPQNPGSMGYCLSVRRSTLDPLLVARAAREATVEYWPDTTVIDVLKDGAQVVGVDTRGPQGETRLTAKLVVGADGRRSTVALAVGAPVEEEEEGHRSLFYRYVKGWTSPDGGAPDAAEFSPAEDEMAYVFPSDRGWTCIAATVSRQSAKWLQTDLAARFDERLRAHKGLAPRLSLCRDQTRMFGGPTGTNYVRGASGPGWLLIGDAGQHQDPWTGFGMDLAGLTAAAAARHIGQFLAGSLSEETLHRAWAEERDTIGRDTWRATVEGSRQLGG